MWGKDSQLDKEKVAGDITIQNDFITKTTQVTGLLFLKLDIDTTKHISSPHRMIILPSALGSRY